MSTTWHSIELDAGPFSWVVTPATLAADDPSLDGCVLDTLRIDTGWDTERPMYGPNGPWTATFGLVVRRFADVAQLHVGDPVTIMVWADTPGALMPWPAPNDNAARPPLGHFVGKVSDLDAQPHRSGRTLVTVTCTDTLVDLGQYTVGTVAYPQEIFADRLTRMFNEAGVICPSAYMYGWAKATTPNPQTLLEAATALLTETTGSQGVVDASPQGRQLCVPYLSPNIALVMNAAGTDVDYHASRGIDPAAPFTIGFAYKKWDGGVAGEPRNLPGQLKLTSAGWDVDVLPRVAIDDVVAASGVDLEVQWRRSRDQRVDKVTVTTADDTPSTWYRYMPNPVPIEYQIDCDSLLGAPDNGQEADVLAATLLPEQAENNWAADAITIHELPAEFAVTWFSVLYEGFRPLRRLLVVNGVAPDLNPTGLPFYMGTPTNGSLIFEGGAWTIELQMSPSVPRPYAWPADWLGVDQNGDGVVDAKDNPPYLYPTSLPAGIRPVDLAPTVTPYSLRIVRRTDP